MEKGRENKIMKPREIHESVKKLLPCNNNNRNGQCTH